MLVTPGIVYKKELLMGMDELSWLQAQNSEEARKARLASMKTHGLVVNRHESGDLDQNWRVQDDDDDGTITIDIAAKDQLYGGSGALPASSVAVDANGRIIRYDLEETMTIPDDSVWYSIVVRYLETEYGRGTLSVTAGSNVVIGTNTEFTRFSGVTTDAYGRGTRIRIDAADTVGGNAGTYEIDVVVSDTEIRLTANIAGANEAGIEFTVAGDYANAPPADPDIQVRAIAQFERVALVRDPASTDLVLADVMRNALSTPEVSIIDRRQQNIYRTLSQHPPHGVAMEIPLYVDLTGGAAPYAANLDFRQAYGAAAANAAAAAIAPRNDGGLLGVFEEAGAIYGKYWNGLNWIAIALIDAAGVSPALQQVPEQSGYTHVLLYVQGVSLYCRRSADNGATWSAAALIFDPTAVDPADTLSHPSLLLLQSRRLIFAVQYTDASAGGDSNIIGGFSDDTGAAWDVGAGAGWGILLPTIPVGVADYPCLVQEEDGTCVCLYTMNNTTIGYTRSRNLSARVVNPFPWTSGIPSGWNSPIPGPAGIAAFYDNFMACCAWACPDGPVVVFYCAYLVAGSNMDIRVAVLGFGSDDSNEPQTLSDTRLFEVDGALGATQAMGLSCCQDRSGRLWLTWLDTVSVLADVNVMALIPRKIPLTNGIVRI